MFTWDGWTGDSYNYEDNPLFYPVNNSAIEFFGETSPNGGVFVPLDGAPANIGSGDFTVDGWIRPSSTASDNQQSGGGVNGNIFMDRDRLSPNLGGFGLSLDAGVISQWFDRSGSSPTSYIDTGTTDLRDGNWHHVRMSWDSSDGDVCAHVDGDLEIDSSGNAPVGGSVEYSFISGEGTYDSDLTYGVEKAGFIGFSFTGEMTEWAWFDALLYTPGSGCPSTIVVPTSRWPDATANMVNQENQFEERRITVRANQDTDEEFNVVYKYEVENILFINDN